MHAFSLSYNLFPYPTKTNDIKLREKLVTVLIKCDRLISFICALLHQMVDLTKTQSQIVDNEVKLPDKPRMKILDHSIS